MEAIVPRRTKLNDRHWRVWWEKPLHEVDQEHLRPGERLAQLTCVDSRSRALAGELLDMR